MHALRAIHLPGSPACRSPIAQQQENENRIAVWDSLNFPEKVSIFVAQIESY